MRTLYHQVSFPDNQTIAPDSYFYCASKACPVAYFSETGNIITKRKLRTYNDIMGDKLCYCFDIDATQYQSALSGNTADAIRNFVMQKTKSGECACNIRNPNGQCCLASFKSFEL